MTKRFSGCGTALVTPFTSQGEVDFACFKKLVARQLAAGIDFLVPLGSTAETACLSLAERQQLLEITIVENAGQVPILVGVGSNCLAAVLENIQRYQNLAVDGFLVVTPYYSKPTQAGLLEFFSLLAQATSAQQPLVLYNVPGRTGVNLSASTALQLAQRYPTQIVAIKEASGNYSQCSEILAQAPAGFDLLSGDDGMTLALMATGASGVISVASNLVPNEMLALVHALLPSVHQENAAQLASVPDDARHTAGSTAIKSASQINLSQARYWHARLLKLFSALFVESNPIPVKCAMSQLGLLQNQLRLPLVPASTATASLLRQIMQELTLL